MNLLIFFKNYYHNDNNLYFKNKILSKLYKIKIDIIY